MGKMDDSDAGVLPISRKFWSLIRTKRHRTKKKPDFAVKTPAKWGFYHWEKSEQSYVTLLIVE